MEACHGTQDAPSIDGLPVLPLPSTAPYVVFYSYLWTIDGKIKTFEVSSPGPEVSSQTTDQTKQPSHGQRAG